MSTVQFSGERNRRLPALLVYLYGDASFPREIFRDPKTLLAFAKGDDWRNAIATAVLQLGLTEGKNPPESKWKDMGVKESDRQLLRRRKKKVIADEGGDDNDDEWED